MAVSRVFGLKAWNPWWFHWNQGFWRSWRPKASNFAKIPWFQWIPPRCFKLLYPNNTWIPPFWSAEFHWIPYQKKKYERVSHETPHMVIFGQKTAYFGSMKPGHKKKTPKWVIYLWNHKSFTETDSALTWNHLRFQKNCLILILRREIDLQVSKQTRLKIVDNSPLEFADTSFSPRQGKNTLVRGKSW